MAQFGFAMKPSKQQIPSGQLGKLEMSGDYEFMSFYENLDGKWILVSESITRRQTSMKAALSG